MERSTAHALQEGTSRCACMCAQVQDDIVQVLQLRSPVRLLSSFNRPNISYAVRYQLAGSKPPVEQIAQLLGSDSACIAPSFRRRACMLNQDRCCGRGRL